jgi:hypothetical protein
VAKQMATLSEGSQVEFWDENFRPLIEQEDLIRRKVVSVAAALPEE